jgi:hypothetical protein
VPPFTLFNGLTIALLVFTIWLMVVRLQMRFASPWPLLYYVYLTAFWRFFGGSFQGFMVIPGVICALLLRLVPLTGWPLVAVRSVELIVLAYVALRALGLLLLWPPFL